MEEEFGGGEQNLEEVLTCQYKSGTNVTRGRRPSYYLLLGEVEAKSFVLNIGHLKGEGS
jgi:hypothetical protein